jgi:hypothetical protein
MLINGNGYYALGADSSGPEISVVLHGLESTFEFDRPRSERVYDAELLSYANNVPLLAALKRYGLEVGDPDNTIKDNDEGLQFLTSGVNPHDKYSRKSQHCVYLYLNGDSRIGNERISSLTHIRLNTTRGIFRSFLQRYSFLRNELSDFSTKTVPQTRSALIAGGLIMDSGDPFKDYYSRYFNMINLLSEVTLKYLGAIPLVLAPKLGIGYTNIYAVNDTNEVHVIESSPVRGTRKSLVLPDNLNMFTLGMVDFTGQNQITAQVPQ